MKNVILLILVLSFGSCAIKKNTEIEDKSNFTFASIAESFDTKKTNYIGFKKNCIGINRLEKATKINCRNCYSKNDIDKALILMSWTHNKWKHNGNNQPKEANALYILEQADNGEQFRCVEYRIVLSATLNSINIPTRTLGLKTKDVET